MLRGLLGGFARGRRQTSAATLVLDFLAGLNDSRITYSGGANGTRVNSSGNIVSATTPRFDYDPVTLAARGLLVEEARTNLLLHSGDLSNAAWTSFGALTVTSGASDPAGETSGVTLNDTDAANFSTRYQDVVVANDSAQRTVTFFLKQGTASESTIQIIYAGGTPLFYNAVVTWATKTVAPGASAGPTDVSITPWYDGYYRVSVRGANNSTGNTAMRAGIFPAGTSSVAATGSCIAWGGQCELGTFPTSYIPTTSASVTRTADSAVMTGTNFSSWYNQSEGTFIVAASAYNSVNGVSSQPSAYGVSDGTNNNFIEVSRLATSAAVRSRVTTGGASQFNSINSSWPVDVIAKVGTTYKVNDFAAVLSGGTVFTDATGTIPAVDRLQIGGLAGASIWNGHIRSITYYPTARPNSLQALTT